MARLALIASEVGYATGFPNGDILLQKPRPNEGRGVVPTAIHLLYANDSAKWIIFGASRME